MSQTKLVHPVATSPFFGHCLFCLEDSMFATKWIWLLLVYLRRNAGWFGQREVQHFCLCAAQYFVSLIRSPGSHKYPTDFPGPSRYPCPPLKIFPTPRTHAAVRISIVLLYLGVRPGHGDLHGCPCGRGAGPAKFSLPRSTPVLPAALSTARRDVLFC